MKLPKKYQGVTPGPWKRDGDQIVGDIDNDGHFVVALLGKKAMKREVEANADLLADSPRLAAAVVTLREALESLIQSTGYSSGKANEALLSTAEWKA